MISLTERARKKFQEIAENVPEDHNVIWDVVFMGFG